jgi:hypothetical protein
MELRIRPLNQMPPTALLAIAQSYQRREPVWAPWTFVAYGSHGEAIGDVIPFRGVTKPRNPAPAPVRHG